MPSALLRLTLACVLAALTAAVRAAEPAEPGGPVAAAAVPGLVTAWRAGDLQHQPEASDLFVRDGFAYTGGGAPGGRVAKVDAATGAVAWAHQTHQGYQPSHPVSNGRVVVFGSYYHVRPDGGAGGGPDFVALDDRTGAVRWRVPTGDQNMSAACFAGDLVVAGSYDGHVYAVDWATGAVRWKTPLGAAIRSAPCVVPGNAAAGDDAVAIGCYDGRLYFLDRKTGRVAAAVDCGGRVEADVVAVGGGLLLVAADGQTLKDPYRDSKLRTSMLVIDARRRKVAARVPAADGSFGRKVVVAGDTAYFFDDANLYALDARAGAVAWKVKAPEGLQPYPVLAGTWVVLPFNRVGRHGEGSSKVAVLDRRTGRELSAHDRGGVQLLHALYGQEGALVVTADPSPAGYKLSSLE